MAKKSTVNKRYSTAGAFGSKKSGAGKLRRVLFTILVLLIVAATVFFLLVTVSWRFYIPGAADQFSPALRQVFSQTPRMIIAGLAVYAVTQFFDVWIYHKIWDLTTERLGDRDRLLWLRNNAGTILSQLINAVLFNLLAFWGIYDGATLVNIIISTFVIYAVTALADTPFVYAARKIARKKGNRQ